jgi:hypothetical protein
VPGKSGFEIDVLELVDYVRHFGGSDACLEREGREGKQHEVGREASRRMLLFSFVPSRPLRPFACQTRVKY